MNAHPEKIVLIIEDDPKISELVEIHLKDLGYRADTAEDGESGLEKALAGDYALIILDLMLPELDGFEVCKAIREKDKKIPILMLTSKTDVMDKVLGLELGADDYLTKPFSIRELVARVKAIFRRVEVDKEEVMPEPQARLIFRDLVIDLENRNVQLSGQPLELTVKEFELLTLFAKKPGRTYSRQQLLDIIWGYQFMGYEHTVNTHINRLRKKIETDPANPEYIQTVWGVGYRFAASSERTT
jgi:two-component system alkaline phosphatase synthesis response regulator PhoP